MEFTLGLPEICLGGLLFGVIIWLLRLLFTETVKTLIQKEHAKFLEDLKWEVKSREQAVRVAEYLALARSLEGSPVSYYIHENKMSWELAMWLPEDIYRQMVRSVINPSDDVNALTTVIAIRKLLLNEKAGNLKWEDIAYHAPGIGKETC